MSGVLYLIPNTLGATDALAAGMLQDVIPDQVQQLTAGLGYLIAENAKTTRAFLKLIATRHALARPLQDIRITELNINTPGAALAGLIAPLLAGEDAGLISEAGVPAVADPGANLVRLAHHHGIIVRPLVGPSSLLLAVMASGLNGQSFAFNGYLPVEAGLRIKRIRELETRSRAEKQTQLFIETPYRNTAMLEALANTCQAKTLVCVATDLTLASENIATRTADQWKQTLANGHSSEIQRRPTVFLLLAE